MRVTVINREEMIRELGESQNYGRQRFDVKLICTGGRISYATVVTSTGRRVAGFTDLKHGEAAAVWLACRCWARKNGFTDTDAAVRFAELCREYPRLTRSRSGLYQKRNQNGSLM